VFFARHPGENRDPGRLQCWIPAFAGMTSIVSHRDLSYYSSAYKSDKDNLAKAGPENKYFPKDPVDPS
jgi:hypothetical protein